jgi:hypothetical protein
MADKTGSAAAAVAVEQRECEERILRPEWTFTGAAFEQGVRVHVSTSGRIQGVYRIDDAMTDELLKVKEERVKGALLPGFVNAHSHAFQRLLRGKGEVYDQTGDSTSAAKETATSDGDGDGDGEPAKKKARVDDGDASAENDDDDASPTVVENTFWGWRTEMCW